MCHVCRVSCAAEGYESDDDEPAQAQVTSAPCVRVPYTLVHVLSQLSEARSAGDAQTPPAQLARSGQDTLQRDKPAAAVEAAGSTEMRGSEQSDAEMRPAAPL